MVSAAVNFCTVLTAEYVLKGGRVDLKVSQQVSGNFRKFQEI
jgi:hypothetical protein